MVRDNWICNRSYHRSDNPPCIQKYSRFWVDREAHRSWNVSFQGSFGPPLSMQGKMRGIVFRGHLIWIRQLKNWNLKPFHHFCIRVFCRISCLNHYHSNPCTNAATGLWSDWKCSSVIIIKSNLFWSTICAANWNNRKIHLWGCAQQPWSRAQQYPYLNQSY